MSKRRFPAICLLLFGAQVAKAQGASAITQALRANAVEIGRRIALAADAMPAVMCKPTTLGRSGGSIVLSDAASYTVTSDGRGPYRNGVDNVGVSDGINPAALIFTAVRDPDLSRLRTIKVKTNAEADRRFLFDSPAA